MKKQLTIYTLTFEFHAKVYNEYSDFNIVNRRFTADRGSHILAMVDYDGNGVKQSVTLDGGKCPNFFVGLYILLRYLCGQRITDCPMMTQMANRILTRGVSYQLKSKNDKGPPKTSNPKDARVALLSF